MATQYEHYLIAESLDEQSVNAASALIQLIEDGDATDEDVQEGYKGMANIMARAQLHATLALYPGTLPAPVPVKVPDPAMEESAHA